MGKEKAEAQKIAKAPQNTAGAFFYPDEQVVVKASTIDEAEKQLNSLKEKK